MKVLYAAKSDVGRGRESNEDAYLADLNSRLFIVADGMGGHAGGETASKMAVEIVHSALLSHRKQLDAFASGDSAGGRRDILATLEGAVQEACAKVFMQGQTTAELRGMGTTLALLLILGSRGFIAHVGDSRIYLIRQGQVHQLTEDHSLVNELLKQGRLYAGSDVPHRYQSAVTRAVGIYESVEVDSLDFDILPGDRFLLTTDGLHGYLLPHTILELTAGNDEEKTVQRLVDYANDHGGKDNITVISIHVPEVSSDVDHEEIRRRLTALKRQPLFEHLDYQELVKVTNIAVERDFRPEQVIFRENDLEDCLYLVLSGEVVIRKNGVEVARLGSGTHFGEMALLDRAARSADAEAAEETKTLILTRSNFYDLLRGNPTLAVKILWRLVKELSARLRTTSDQLTVLKSLGVGQEPSGRHGGVLPPSWLEPMADSDLFPLGDLPSRDGTEPPIDPAGSPTPAATAVRTQSGTDLRIVREEPENVSFALDRMVRSAGMPPPPVQPPDEAAPTSPKGAPSSEESSRPAPPPPPAEAIAANGPLPGENEQAEEGDDE